MSPIMHTKTGLTSEIHRNDSIADKIDLRIEQTNAFCFGSCGGGEPDLAFGINPFTFTVDADVSGAYLRFLKFVYIKFVNIDVKAKAT